MIDIGRRKGTVRFRVSPGPGARNVCLAGDFSNWQPINLQKQKDGSFTTELSLPPGTYQYKFICDGRWVADPDNQRQAANPYGTTNSVAVVT